MNIEKWNALPEDVKAVIENLRVEQALWTGTYMDNHVKEANAWSEKEQGVEFIRLSPAEKAKWDAKLTFMTEDWIKSATEKGYPGEAIVNDIKALTAKHAGK